MEFLDYIFMHYLGQKTDKVTFNSFKIVPSSMTVKHLHYALVAHAPRIMMTSACLIACVVTFVSTAQNLCIKLPTK